MAKKHRLKEMTWIEFGERLEEDDPVILLPFASQEQQGPHAPMGDYMLTERIVDMVAAKSGAIAAPIIPFGYADYFRPFAGGIQFRPETFRAVLEDICENFLNHGLGRIVIMNGHGGNIALIDQSVRAIKEDHNIWIPCLNLWRMLTPEKWKELHGERAGEASGHGGDPMTSVYLHLFPDLMRMDLIRKEERKTVLGLPPSGLNAVEFQGVDVNLPLDIDDICDSGIAGGNPTLSSAEIGKRIVDHIVGLSVDFIEYFKKQTTKT